MSQQPPVNSIVAEKIRRVAADKRINQTTLGAAINVTQSGFSKRLLGRIPFSIDELAALAQVLEIPLTELISAEPAAS